MPFLILVRYLDKNMTKTAKGCTMDARTNTLLQRAEDALEDLRAHLAGKALQPGWTREEQRVGAVLADVLSAGGRVPVDEWRKIGLAHGYDPRGLSGYFTGHSPSMLSAGDDRVLTPRGRKVAEDWQRMYAKGS